MATQPLFVSSGDLIADRRYRWALEFLKQGDPVAAAEVLEQVLETVPGFATAWFALASIRERQGDPEAALTAYRAAAKFDPEDYHGAKLHLARLGEGEAAPTMTATYVRRLFDQYAPDFDVSLLQFLGYRGPAVLLEALTGVRGAPLQFGAVLDLGCGTGLAGEAFRPLCQRLVGVDVSPEMVELAGKKDVYDRLVAAELLEFLTSDEPGQYDLVLAADVFVYCADLGPIAAAVSRVLAPGGLFAFTVEAHEGPGVILQPTLRYAHDSEHVCMALQAASLRLASIESNSTRLEMGHWVPGLVVVASAPPPSGDKVVP